MFRLTAAKWIGTSAGLSGVIMIALNLALVIYGFGLFLISSLLWSVIGRLQREMNLLVLQGTFTVINIVGYRWLGNRFVLGLLLALPVVSGAVAQDRIIGVASVIDGDTIEIHGQRIRLFGIDAPESSQLCVRP